LILKRLNIIIGKSEFIEIELSGPTAINVTSMTNDKTRGIVNKPTNAAFL